MRFSIVARSLGVILASPLLALPLGFAGESEPPLHAATHHAIEASVVGSARVERTVLDQRVLDQRVLDQRVLDQRVLDQRVLDQRALEDRALEGRGAPSEPAGPPPSTTRAPQEFEVMVSCAADGCVVSAGLDVVVVASPPRR